MTRKRILIVEDETLISMMLEDFLDAIDMEPMTTCNSVQSALEALANERPDAAIVDVNLLSGEKSWPIADELASLNIPFILSSGGDEVVDRHADRPHLHKPYTLDVVEAALRDLR